MAACDGMVNTTPLGTSKHPGMAVPAETLRPQMWVAEVVYFPLETELLRAARALGCRTADGGGMVVFQAAEAFRLFTGVEPDAERILACFRADAAKAQASA
jgi:shikimate dehydrogenase